MGKIEYTNKELGMMSAVTITPEGRNIVTLIDTDANETLGIVKIFPSTPDAMEYAKKLVQVA